MEYVLRTTDLTKVYSKKAAVNKVNLNVKKGDIYGFIGKNGAGKTTMIRMIAGLAYPTAGSIELFGSMDGNTKRKGLGVIVENPAAYLTMTAEQNLEVFRILYGIEDKDCVKKTLELVGLTDTGKKKTKNFSLGMKQRLGIAIALLGTPEFLILDEPINGLDPTGIREVRELILKLNKEHGITILISSHILGELSKMATCYGIINNGILIEEFSSEELITRCKRSIKLIVDDTSKAASILETVVGTKSYSILPDNTISIFDHLDDSGYVNSELAKNGVVIQSSSIDGQDLEGYFMELMEGKYHE